MEDGWRDGAPWREKHILLGSQPVVLQLLHAPLELRCTNRALDYLAHLCARQVEGRMLRRQVITCKCRDDIRVQCAVRGVAEHNIAWWQVVQKLLKLHGPRRRRFVVRATCQAGDDVTHLPMFVRYVLDVNGVAGLPMPAAEVSVSSTVWPLYFRDKPVYEEYNLVVVELRRIVWVLKWLLQRHQLLSCRQWYVSAIAFAQHMQMMRTSSVILS